MKIIKENSNIVIFLFDLYVIFKYMLIYFQVFVDLIRGESLLSYINKLCYCERVGVVEYYCLCVQWKEIDISLSYVQCVVQVVVDYVNSFILLDLLGLSFCFCL